MDADSFINMLKEVIRRYDESSCGSTTNRELEMWRRRFLNNNPCITGNEDQHKKNYVSYIFLSLPSHDLITRDLLEILDEITHTYSQDNK
jgi:hypothetical protein